MKSSWYIVEGCLAIAVMALACGAGSEQGTSGISTTEGTSTSGTATTAGSSTTGGTSTSGGIAATGNTTGTDGTSAAGPTSGSGGANTGGTASSGTAFGCWGCGEDSLGCRCGQRADGSCDGLGERADCAQSYNCCFTRPVGDNHGCVCANASDCSAYMLDAGCGSECAEVTDCPPP